MHPNAAGLVDGDVTRRVIGAFYVVYNELGVGFLEAVYRNALAVELRDGGVDVTVEAPIVVHYKRRPVGHYRADLLVDRRVVVELKATERLHPSARAQLRHYLRATGLTVGLLLHVGERPSVLRVDEPCRKNEPETA